MVPAEQVGLVQVLVLVRAVLELARVVLLALLAVPVLALLPVLLAAQVPAPVAVRRLALQPGGPDRVDEIAESPMDPRKSWSMLVAISFNDGVRDTKKRQHPKGPGSAPGPFCCGPSGILHKCSPPREIQF